jgi:hypothetical protein
MRLFVGRGLGSGGISRWISDISHLISDIYHQISRIYPLIFRIYQPLYTIYHSIFLIHLLIFVIPHCLFNLSHLISTISHRISRTYRLICGIYLWENRGVFREAGTSLLMHSSRRASRNPIIQGNDPINSGEKSDKWRIVFRMLRMGSCCGWLSS